MFGKITKFKCPCCEFQGTISLGITKFVNIKNKASHLAITNCPKCEKIIAFNIVDRKEEPSISFDLSSIDKDDIEEEMTICF